MHKMSGKPEGALEGTLVLSSVFLSLQQRQTLENELNAIKDVRLNTLLCIVTSDWAFQVCYIMWRVDMFSAFDAQTEARCSDCHQILLPGPV